MLGSATPAPFLDDRHRDLDRSLAGFADEVRAIPAAEDDAAGRVQARELLTRIGAAGWCRYAVPGAWGGAQDEIDLRSLCLIRERLAWASPLADAVFALQALGSMPIARGDSAAAKQEWLPRVARGEAMAAFAMTEPEAGSDVKAMQTVARRREGGYVLDGRKAFISNAGLADFYTTFARAPENDNAIGCFVVAADALGLRFAGPQILSEPHPLGEIEFEGCEIPESARLDHEGRGLELGFQTLDRLRATVAAAACGMAARALEEALEHARARHQFGRPLAQFQMTQQKLATMATELDAARLLTYRAAWQSDCRGEVTMRSAMAKLYATEAAQRIVDNAVQILGGRGALADHPVDRLYRSVRALRIYEGTSEIQQLVIARDLVRGG